MAPMAAAPRPPATEPGLPGGDGTIETRAQYVEVVGFPVASSRVNTLMSALLEQLNGDAVRTAITVLETLADRLLLLQPGRVCVRRASVLQRPSVRVITTGASYAAASTLRSTLPNDVVRCIR